ncbi:uncharacterized protein E0L32_003348 [Thyridium curvatum]|uniref:Telomere-associated protein Rif1 N-terminal domain-containing protein n=1 Tax=Thyridium curvatum TaxID=1093900 RepID=A0A507BKJ1_9PEZI|nr:uncharacterized protein E0L32_003348 [Thyridium curvatum]TPX17230.1 hypothetical protein E0L32_003348 [Thyridium curvatum]
MGSIAPPSNLLENLPARPPTPPRETHHENETALKQALLGSKSESRRSLHTPPNVYTPSSTASDSSRRKKVVFSAQAEYKEPPNFVDGSSTHPTPVSVLPPSASKQPGKSILKVAYAPSPLQSTHAFGLNGESMNQANIATMLDSTIKQLAGKDRDSKLDAYMMLGRALKNSNNLPDRIALQDKMSLFMQFIQRDMTSKTATGSLDSTLINHALNLLSTFLHFPAIASTLSNEFGIFVIDHCIRSFEDSSIPKDVTRHLMQVVAYQNFSPKVMTSDRVGRMVVALHKIEEHIKGKSIVMSRLHIYRRLVKQCRQLMVVHSDWLLDLFTDMLSSMKEIRSCAISLGLEAAFAVGREKQMTRRVMEVFQLTLEEKTYIEFYAERLKAMLKEKHESAAVPQVWSVVILFLRGPDKWEYFGNWLRIIQDCFNISDYHTKNEANYAWNRLVYSLHTEDRSLSKMISTLAQPLVAQLRRKGTGKQSDDLRRTVLGGICNLFYYAFKPTTNLIHLDAYWDNAVRPLVKQLVDLRPEESKEYHNQACAILTGLFDCTTPRRWREERVADSPLVQPEELPAIDAKWLRRNSKRVFALIEPLLERTFLDLSTSRSATHKLWCTLIGAVASAASKEIKVSLDTATFVAHAFGLLMRIWNKGLPQASEAHDGQGLQFLTSMREFVLVMVEALGLLPFTEKQLSMKHNTFIPIATPSHRSGKGEGVPRSPLQHLYSILFTLPPGIADGEDFAEFIKSVFAPFFAAKNSKGQSNIAQEMLQSMPMDALSPYGPWLAASEKIAAGLESAQHSNQTVSSSNEALVGHEYRDVVRVLERGLRSTPNLPWIHWQVLCATLCDRVRDETGDAGLAIAVIEPLAKVILDIGDQMSLSTVRSAIELLSVAAQPRDRQAVEAARRRVWGTVIAGSRSSSFDPFDALYKAVNHTLVHLYASLNMYNCDEVVVPALSELSCFLDRCNPQLMMETLVALQDGLAPWVKDDQAQLNSRQSTTAAEAAKSLWDKVCNILGNVESPDMVPLDELEPLLSAAFESKHRHIVNTVSTAWNRIFDHAEEINYPETLKNILLSRRSVVDLVLPGLEVSSAGSPVPRQSFIDSQDDLDALGSSAKRNNITPRPSSSHRSLSPLPVTLSLPAKRQVEKAPPRSKTPKRAAKLRHDDSQIQFAPIDTSPFEGHDVESQVLTERQKEVRERQQENAVLFPDIRSSPSAKLPTPSRVASSQPAAEEASPHPPRAATPEGEGGFDDFITSTPTPRRGQPVALPEGDPPSSPPEPRRYPLLPEIETRSNSNSLMDEWQFSSSPISGSPVTAVHKASVQRVRDFAEQVVDAMDVDRAEDEEPDLPGVADETFIAEELPAIKQPVFKSPKAQRYHSATPITPTRLLRSRAGQETPRSGSDIFVDAPTSPLHSSPRVRRGSQRSKSQQILDADSQEGDQSFVVSEGDERSMLRLVVELDPRDAPSPSKYRKPSESPAKSPAKSPPKAASPVLDCITVGGSKNGRGRAAKKTKLEPTIPSTPAEAAPVEEAASGEVNLDEDAAVDASQESSRSSRKKRKRSSKSQEGSGKKRRSRRHTSSQLGAEEVPDSQVAALKHAELTEEASQSSVFPESESMDLDVVNDDQLLLQSQIASEHEAHSQRSEAGEEGGNLQGDVLLHTVEVTDEVTDEVVGRVSEDVASASVRKTEEQNVEPAEAVEEPTGKFEQIMAALRSGLVALRSATLSRAEVSEVEDMCMDVKRELYEAERRGRD